MYYIDKVFVSGLLKGLRFEDRMSFVDDNHAENWFYSVASKQLPYIVKRIINTKTGKIIGF